MTSQGEKSDYSSICNIFYIVSTNKTRNILEMNKTCFLTWIIQVTKNTWNWLLKDTDVSWGFDACTCIAQNDWREIVY